MKGKNIKKVLISVISGVSVLLLLIAIFYRISPYTGSKLSEQDFIQYANEAKPLLLALEKYLQDYGTWPKSIESLIPQYIKPAKLPNLPDDYWNGWWFWNLGKDDGGIFIGKYIRPKYNWKEMIYYTSGDDGLFHWFYDDDQGFPDTPRKLNISLLPSISREESMEPGL